MFSQSYERGFYLRLEPFWIGWMEWSDADCFKTRDIVAGLEIVEPWTDAFFTVPVVVLCSFVQLPVGVATLSQYSRFDWPKAFKPFRRFKWVCIKNEVSENELDIV